MKRAFIIAVSMGYTYSTFISGGTRKQVPTRLISPRVSRIVQQQVLPRLERSLTNPVKVTRRYSTQKIKKGIKQRLLPDKNIPVSSYASSGIARSPSVHQLNAGTWIWQKLGWTAPSLISKDQFTIDVQTKKKLRKYIPYSDPLHYTIEHLMYELTQTDSIDRIEFVKEFNTLFSRLQVLSAVQLKEIVKLYSKQLALICAQLMILPSDAFQGDGKEKKVAFIALLAQAGLTDVVVPTVKRGVLRGTLQIDWSKSITLSDFLRASMPFIEGSDTRSKEQQNTFATAIEKIKSNSRWWNWW